MFVPAGVHTSTCESHYLVGKNGFVMHVEIHARVKGAYAEGVRMGSDDETPSSSGVTRKLRHVRLLYPPCTCMFNEVRVRTEIIYKDQTLINWKSFRTAIESSVSHTCMRLLIAISMSNIGR